MQQGAHGEPEGVGRCVGRYPGKRPGVPRGGSLGRCWDLQGVLLFITIFAPPDGFLDAIWGAFWMDFRRLLALCSCGCLGRVLKTKSKIHTIASMLYSILWQEHQSSKRMLCTCSSMLETCWKKHRSIFQTLFWDVCPAIGKTEPTFRDRVKVSKSGTVCGLRHSVDHFVLKKQCKKDSKSH